MTFALAENPKRILSDILERCQALEGKAVLAFDLDSTLFNNLPRQVLILREFGQKKQLQVLIDHGLEHWTSGWDMRGAMLAAGLPEAEVEALVPEAREFWRERFFTSAYAEHDTDIAGAADFLEAALGTGALIAYVTGRHEGMRAGTVKAMVKTAMPIPDGARVRLIMKPTLLESDDDFKVEAHQQLHALGTLVAAFDNEPTHVNDYRRSFPEAVAVHLATDHSGRPVPLLPGVVSIRDFSR